MHAQPGPFRLQQLVAPHEQTELGREVGAVVKAAARHRQRITLRPRHCDHHFGRSRHHRHRCPTRQQRRRRRRGFHVVAAGRVGVGPPNGRVDVDAVQAASPEVPAESRALRLVAVAILTALPADHAGPFSGFGGGVGASHARAAKGDGGERPLLLASIREGRGRRWRLCEGRSSDHHRPVPATPNRHGEVRSEETLVERVREVWAGAGEGLAV
mmetsp:Transcript_79141/g.154761  ORF Transcript_79141/g.154761 Transcript_79141/m.154761 type:complete len:214 (-) Transcript_79141:113-754(-)